MELIDRQALLKQIDIDSDGEPGYYGDTWKFIDTIKKMPSVQSTFDARDTQYNLPIGTDLISRQDAIDALCHVDEYNSRSVKAIKQLPPAEPHWIPCSAGLPEEEGFYIVTLAHEDGAETSIRFFKIEDGKRYWSLWGNEIITAWMPKPEPYKGVTE